MHPPQRLALEHGTNAGGSRGEDGQAAGSGGHARVLRAVWPGRLRRRRRRRRARGAWRLEAATIQRHLISSVDIDDALFLCGGVMCMPDTARTCGERRETQGAPA